LHSEEEIGVLRLSKLGPGREQYYLQTVGLEPPGEWMGRGPQSAGLFGPVGAAELTSFLSGRDPRSGEVLGTSRNRVRVTGFDLTFAAPKSVSVLYGLADGPVSDQVKEGHRAAVSAAISYMEDRALGVRRGRRPDRTVEPLDGAFGAAFLHRTSRALDPHLHSHVVVANLGCGPDGRFSALDGRGIYAHAGAIGALYHVQLREELRARLGVEWGPLDRGRADLAGISSEVRRGFSQRAAAIEADLTAYSTTESAPLRRGGHRAVELASLKTRQQKDLSVGADDLRPVWRQRAIELGLGPARLESVLERDDYGRHDGGRGGYGRDGGGPLVQDPEQVVIRLASAGRAVSRRNVIQAWCMELPRGAQVKEVEKASDALLDRLSREEVRDLGSGGLSRQGRGVAERRLPLESLDLDPLARRFADQALERRIALRRDSAREPGLDVGRERRMGMGRERDLGHTDVGLGLGL
jgi:conjugative relaxase-like TrwC/TraI family protein